MRTETYWRALGAVALLALAILFAPRPAWAHCDTLDGPVVTAARTALDKGDLTPVLGWIRAEHEPAGLVAREHAVGDQHRRRAGVLGQHAYGEAVAIVVVARAVRATGGAARVRGR